MAELKIRYKYLMTKEGKNPKGEPFKEVTCLNKVQKASFQKYGFKSNPIGLPGNITKEKLLQILEMQNGKLKPAELKMSKEELIQEI